jgi:hypothetical protein
MAQQQFIQELKQRYVQLEEEHAKMNKQIHKLLKHNTALCLFIERQTQELKKRDRDDDVLTLPEELSPSKRQTLMIDLTTTL